MAMNTNTLPWAASQKPSGQPARLLCKSRAKKTTPKEAANQASNSQACTPNTVAKGRSGGMPDTGWIAMPASWHHHQAASIGVFYWSANCFQVAITESGFSEIEEIPARLSHWAKSG